jgi:chromate transport protein ChrA
MQNQSLKQFTAYYPIVIPVSNYTIMSANKDNTYGLGIFERVFVMTIIMIFVVGIAALVGQAVAGMALCLFVMVFLAYIGFIPWALIIISGLAGMILIGSEGR